MSATQIYAGFWLRFVASFIDSALIMMILAPLYLTLYRSLAVEGGPLVAGAANLLLQYVFPAMVVIIFWIYRSATPGKIIIGASIVDAKTGQKPSTGQFIGRYFAYYLSALPLCLGFFWVAFDKRKQGWHDKLAGTVVVKNR